VRIVSIVLGAPAETGVDAVRGLIAVLLLATGGIVAIHSGNVSPEKA
jgi:hypothetical protein